MVSPESLSTEYEEDLDYCYARVQLAESKIAVSHILYIVLEGRSVLVYTYVLVLYVYLKYYTVASERD